jgi:hypothetical protein
MQRDDLLDALVGQVDELQGLVKWLVAFAFTATVLAIQGDDPISVLNLSLTRVQAFFVIAAIYVAACTAALAHLRRLTSLLAGLTPQEIATGFSKLSGHKWLLNPFVVEGSHTKYGSHGAFALVALICVFWLCVASLYALLPQEVLRGPLATILTNGIWNAAAWTLIGSVLVYAIPVGLLAGIGYVALETILRMAAESAERVPSDQPDFKGHLQRYAADLQKAGDHGIAAGGMILLLVLIVRLWP